MSIMYILRRVAGIVRQVPTTTASRMPPPRIGRRVVFAFVMAAAAVDNYNWMADGLIEWSNTSVTEESADAYSLEFQLYGQRSVGDLYYSPSTPRRAPSPFGYGRK